VRSYTARAGESGPETVVLPGLGAVDYLAPWLAAARTPTTLLDLPGYWSGRAHSCRPSIAAIAARCVDWLAATGRRGIVLAGHSTGAQSAIRVAAQCPERVGSLLLVAPTFVPTARTTRGLLRLGAATFLREDPGEIRALLPPYLRAGAAPVVALLADGLRDAPEQPAATIRVPTGVVAGRRDRLAPPWWAEQLADLAGGRATVAPGAHNVCYTSAAELVRLSEALFQ
jgi:pimeloyl-ACP methyl ester carboxylesterase